MNSSDGCPRTHVAGHVAADHVTVGFFAGGLVHDAAVRDDKDTVGKLENLIQVLGDEKHSRSAVACLHNLRANFGDGREVETKTRIGGDQNFDPFTELPCQHGPLDVASREVADFGRGRIGSDAITTDQIDGRGAAWPVA